MRFILAFIFVFSASLLSAQLNPQHIYVNEKQDIPNTIELRSLVFSPTVTNNGFPDSGRDSLYIDPVSGSPGTYLLTFDPPNGYTGDTEISVEYFESGAIPGIPYPNYTTIHYRIQPSKVVAENDYALVNGNNITLSPADNDSSTDGPLSITRLGFVNGGTASVLNDTEIDFSFSAGSSEGSVVYFVKDTLGTMSSGLIRLTQEDNTIAETRSVMLNNIETQILILPSADYTMSSGPAHGTVDAGSEAHLSEYKADNGYSGGDQIVFTNSQGNSITFNVYVVNKPLSNSFVKDDEFHCETNGSIVFNVFDNDLRTDFDIYDYSSELSYNGNGEFIYTPATDFTGDVSLYYKVFSGIQFHTGNIVIHVDDFGPVDELDYSFEILNNHPLKILHHSPIETYTFSVLVPPANGTLTILDSNGEIVHECDDISGNNTIFYEPDTDYNGTDEFDLEYCTLSGNCEIVKVDVVILDSNYEECLCINDCVYEGDNNDDGIVNHKDILDLGLNFGIAGPERTNDFNLLWTGQESNDWGYQQMGTGIDLKCGDADGDGYIDASDVSSIDDYYGNSHKLMATSTAAISNVPIEFIPQQTEVDSGEWLTLDISIGSFAHPAIDMNGAAFSFSIDADLIDSASVQFTLYDDTWLVDDQAPVIEYVKVPQDGKVDIAFSRVSNFPANGLGVIGKLEFIVEDEVHGFKDIQFNANQFPITMHEIISVNRHGEFVHHPDQEAMIRFNRDRTVSQLSISDFVSVYPNPTLDIVNIESRKYSIDKVEVIDVLGRVIHTTQQAYSYQYPVDLSAYEEGMYFVKVYSVGRSEVFKVFRGVY